MGFCGSAATPPHQAITGVCKMSRKKTTLKTRGGTKMRSTLPASKFAPSGISGELIFVPRFDRHPTGAPVRDDRQVFSDNTERDFVVSCMFSTDMGFSRGIDGVVDPQAGASFFRSPTGLSGCKIHTPLGIFDLFVNSEGDFSGATLACRAHSLQEAKRLFLEGLVPTLDHFSYLGNTPFIIARTLVTDEKHKAFSFGYTAPYKAAELNPGGISIHVEMMPIYALYREAKNALSPFYRFLCYYKILEGIYGHLRADVFKKATNAKKQLSTTKERIPDDEVLSKDYPELIGRPIKDFFDNELTADFRDAVAHYFLDNGTLMNVSDPTTTEKFLNILWPIELCCRTVIAQQERYYDQLASTAI